MYKSNVLATGMNRRYVELDSLRGLASLFVVIGHLLMVIPEYASYSYTGNAPVWVYLLKESPLRLIFSSANEAVILFFVLSGFVLSIPYYEGKGRTYGVYMLQRICRIYLPYLCAIVIAVICKLLVGQGGISGLGTWFNRSWTTADSLGLLLGHLCLIGSYQTDAYNNAIWSLVHEMRISILFPVLMYLPMRCSWRQSLAVAAALWAVSSVLLFLERGETSPGSILLTMQYCLLFLSGAYLSKYRNIIIEFFRDLTTVHRRFLLCIGFICYLYEGWAGNVPTLNNLLLRNGAIALGSCIFIVSCLSCPGISAFLQRKALRELGKVSYSLYLYHLIILFTLVYVLHTVMPISIILPLALLVSLCAAKLAYSMIERPACRLGARLADQRGPKFIHWRMRMEEMKVVDVLRLLKRRWRTVLITAVLTAGSIAGAVFFILKPVYESSTQVVLSPAQQAPAYDERSSVQLIASYLDIVKSPVVMQATIQQLKLDMSVSDLQRHISVTNNENSQVVNIAVRDGDPELVREISHVAASVAQQKAQELLRTQGFTVLPGEDTGATEIVFPKLPVSIAISLLVGLMAGIGAAFLRDQLDTGKKRLFGAEREREQQLGM